MSESNMNYEVIPEFPVTVQAKSSIGKVMDDQDRYGFEKYGTPLKHTDNYGWLKMVKEEMADAFKYIECEENRKLDIIKLLENALSNPGDGEIYVVAALEILRMEGTGK